jgi:GT2 family glycosyltransferase
MAQVGLRERAGAGASEPTAPAWSVVVPTFRRPEPLRRCIEALGRMRPDPRFEVVIADDDPDGSAAAVVESVRIEPELRLVPAGGGPAAARNAGARVARGEWIAFTDDDCRPAPDWLAELAAAISEHGADGAAGTTRNGSAGPWSEASQLVVDALHATESEHGLPRFVASNNVAFRRSALLAIGGFDESFPDAAAEDRELCERWIRAGHVFAPAPSALVSHHHDLGPGSFWRQHLRYGRGARAFHAARRRHGWERIRFQPRFYASIGRELREGSRHASAPALAGLAVFSQIANATGYVTAMLAERNDAP